MYYAWHTAAGFSTGADPIETSDSFGVLWDKVGKKGIKKFFSAQGSWLNEDWYDLAVVTHNKPVRYVSDERTNRYLGERRRFLERKNAAEPKVHEPEPVETFAVSEPGESVEVVPEAESEKDTYTLNVDPTIVKAIFEFLALDDETRRKAINALAALSVSADPFKSAVEVMLDDTKELKVELSAGPQEAPDEA